MDRLNKIRDTMKMQGRSQIWLSEKIGVSRNSISKWYHNEIQPKLGDLYKIASALNVDVCDLLVDENPFEDTQGQ